jgi:hypothetical protein
MTLPLFPELPEITDVIDNPTAEDYATAARYALERRRLPLALKQVAAAMVLEPEERSYRRLLSEIVGHTPDPLKLLELSERGTFYGVAAARAWHLASKGRATAAVRLMREVATFRPNTPLLVWVEEWSARPDFARKTEPSAVAELILAFLGALARTEAREGAFRNLAAAAALASAVALMHPQHAGLRAARCQLLRELGDTQLALDLALSGAESWATTVEAASACGELGHRDRQIQLLRRAIALAPEKSSSYWLLGKVLVDGAELAEAEATFLAAPASDDDSDFSSRAAAAYLRYLRTGDRTPLTGFEKDPRPFVQDLVNDARYYDTLLPDPLDRIVDVIRAAVARGSQEPSAAINVKARIDGCATPSALRAFELGLARLGQRGRLTLLGEREPRHLGGLWQMRDAAAVPLVEPASFVVEGDVRELAERAFDWTSWTRAAAGERELDQLLRVAVHPPKLPPHFDAVEWLTRVHTAVALLIAYNVAPWLERLAVIERALAATDDWICGVGIIAWAASTQREPHRINAVPPAFDRLLQQCSGSTLPSYARTLAIVGSGSTKLPAERLSALRARIATARSTTS